MLSERYEQLKVKVMEFLDFSGAVSDEELKQQIEREMLTISEPLPTELKRETVDKVFHSIRGLDVLQPLLNDPEVTEIMVNRHDEIYIEKHGQITRLQDSFES